MSMLLAALMFIPLLALSIAFLLWSFGRSWPLRDREMLAGALTGRPGTPKTPPGWLSFLLAVFFLACGVVALALADHDGGGTVLTVLGVGLSALFLARGIAGYTPAWARTYSAEPFHTMDRKSYSPLALILGVGFAVLVIMRLM
jgi:hypothetical protein